MNDNKAVFETMPVPKALAASAIPAIISQLIAMVYNLADTYFIGKTGDPYKVAAVSLTAVFFFVMNALSNLFGVGGGSLISRLLGKNQPEEARKVCSFSFYGTVFVSLLYSLLCFMFMDPLLRLLGASEDTIVYAGAYTFWVVVAGGLPCTLGMLMAHLFRSEGYAKQASFGLAMGGILNTLLDPWFMFVIMDPGQEVAGAAIATMLSNVIVLCYFALVFVRLRKRTELSLSVKYLLPGLRYTGAVFSVGFPSALSSLLTCISNGVVNHLVSGYGDVPVAAMGIVKKIDLLPMNVGMGLCQGMMPLAAYNYSAQNHKRMKSVITCARIGGMGFAVLCIAVFEIFSGGLIRLFIKEAETLALGTDFLRICCLATPFMISNFQMSYTFQAMGKGAQTLLPSSCRQGILNIPLLFFMNWAFGLYGVTWTQFFADGMALILSFLLYRRVCRQL